MKILYLDCGMGAAGDMLTAALLGLHPDPDAFLKRLNTALGSSIHVYAEKVLKSSITANHVHVCIDGDEEGAAPEKHSHHASVREIYSHIDGTALPDRVKNDAKNVFRLLAEAECHVHGTDMENIHFHELGSLDAMADVLAVSMLLYELQPDRICVSPVSVGSGTVKCAHGILPVPAPAAEYLLRGMPVCSGGIEGELCTPTGAALLKYFADDFGQMPSMVLIKSSFGAGAKDFPRANVLRAMLGESTGGGSEQITELSCNIDDMTAEALGFAMDMLFEAGALDVYFINIGMKKNRPAVMLRCMCRDDKKGAIIRCIFKNTSTLGIREQQCSRYTLRHSIRRAETKYGPVRVKTAEGWGVKREKPEYDDLARIARENSISISEAAEALRG